MRAILTAAILAAAIASATSAAPKHRAVKPVTPAKATRKEEPAACKALSDDYENASKELAKIHSDGRGDSNAVMSRAQITLGFMKDKGCKSPDFAPNEDRYALAALSCAAATSERDTQRRYNQYQGQETPYYFPQECKMDGWKPNK